MPAIHRAKAETYLEKKNRVVPGGPINRAKMEKKQQEELSLQQRLEEAKKRIVAKREQEKLEKLNELKTYINIHQFDNDMLQMHNWKEFQNTGLLWFINTILHLFGWAICMIEDEELDVCVAYPARCKFRGFDGESNDRGYRRVTKFIKNNIDDLLKEAEDEGI